MAKFKNKALDNSGNISSESGIGGLGAISIGQLRSCVPKNIVITSITGGNRITFKSCPGTQTEIWANIDGVGYVLITTLGIGIETYDHTGLYANIVIYKLRSKINVLNAPLNLASSIVVGTGVLLTWVDNNTDFTTIKLYADSGSGYLFVADVDDGVQQYTHEIQDVNITYKILATDGVWSSGYSNTTSENVPSFYDADAAALFDRFTALSETPTTARKTIISDAFTLGKTKAFWAKSDAIWLLAAHGTLSSRLNILADDHNCTPEGTPTFTTDKGWNGPGYLHSDFNPLNDGVNFTLNSAGIGCVSLTDNNGNPALIGKTDAINTYIQQWTDGKIYSGINSTAYTAVNTPGDISKKLIISSRPDANTINVYIDGSKTSQTKTSDSIRDLEFQILGTGTTNQLSFVIIGYGFTDQDVADIKEVFVSGYLTDIGAI